MFSSYFIQVNARGIVCVNDGLSIKLKSFASTSNTKPTLETLADGYTLVSSYNTESNAVVCEFNKELSISSGSENLMLDLNNPVYVLYAAGAYTTDIQYHSRNRYITSNQTYFEYPFGLPVCIMFSFTIIIIWITYMYCSNSNLNFSHFATMISFIIKLLNY